jgi:8-oxo-dGTP pyrophosphatase MutT (NUDIX family)
MRGRGRGPGKGRIRNVCLEVGVRVKRGPVEPIGAEEKAVREWTVAVFVVHEGRVLLLRHRKLGKWLPPGGHIEPGELPDEAAVREVWEEAGIKVELVGGKALAVADPVQLVRPRGIQLETIAPGHQHIDLVYLARVVGSPALTANEESTRLGWFGPEELPTLDLTEEIRSWVHLALSELAEG